MDQVDSDCNAMHAAADRKCPVCDRKGGVRVLYIRRQGPEGFDALCDDCGVYIMRVTHIVLDLGVKPADLPSLVILSPQ